MALTDRLADYRRFEGFRSGAYWDPIGKCWTAGYGHTGEDVTARTVCGRTTAETWLSLDDGHAVAALDADPTWQFWRMLSDTRRDALVELAFNMGEHKLDAFVHMRAALIAGDYTGAAAAAIDSLWYAQVNGDGRGDFIAAMLRDGARPTPHTAA